MARIHPAPQHLTWLLVLWSSKWPLFVGAALEPVEISSLLEQPVVLFWWVNLILSRNLAPKAPTPVSIWERRVEVRMVPSCTGKDLAYFWCLKVCVCFFFKGTLLDAWCDRFSSGDCFQLCPRGSVSGAIFILRPHLLSTTRPRGLTFLTVFLMSKSFSWPFPHISCLAVYSWWVWVLLWQRFLTWSSAWSRARVDYCNRPCYGLLLFFPAVVAATEDPQCVCHSTWCQFTRSLLQGNGSSGESRHRWAWMPCNMFP